MVDDILKNPSSSVFCKEVERCMTEIFKCSRANLVLVNRFKKDLFRYEFDAKT